MGRGIPQIKDLQFYFKKSVREEKIKSKVEESNKDESKNKIEKHKRKSLKIKLLF